MIELIGVEKVFGQVRAVDGLSFKIHRGEVFGLLGKNGAGKTTTIKMLTLQLKPTAGEIFFKDKKILGNEIFIKSLLGVVPQHLNFDQDLTVEENLELHARLHHMAKSARRERIEELLKFVELEHVRKSFIRELSGGMKRRLLIVRALIHRPKILFLDEPTVALDPQVRHKIWELIKLEGAGNHNRIDDALHRGGGKFMRPRGDFKSWTISRAGHDGKSLRGTKFGRKIHTADKIADSC